MNILLINPVHPSTPHISAVRAWRFGTELSKFGHRVVLLCAAISTDTISGGEELARHDWSSPHILAPTTLKHLHSHRAAWPATLRRAETLRQMLASGGLQSLWMHRAIRVMSSVELFRPDVIWTTFGKMEAVVAARRLAKIYSAPWVLDVKDNWELYVPRGLRRVMALRTAGWSALTANSEFTRDKSREWQRGEATVVYSGLDDAFFGAAEENIPDNTKFTINLVGSLYFVTRVHAILDGIGRWVSRLSPAQRDRVELCYMGADVSQFRECVKRSGCRVTSRSMGYVAPAEMASACRRAAVNAYVAHEGTFHHKLLELLACGRPLMAYPAERDESRRLTALVHGKLLEPRTSESVANELDKIHQRWTTTGFFHSPPRGVERFSWSCQTRVLEEVLLHVARS